MSNIVQINFNDLAEYDFSDVIDKMKEIALEINPLVLMLGNANFLIEGRVMNLDKGFPPKLEISFIYHYTHQHKSDNLFAVSTDYISNPQEIKDHAFKVDLYEIVNDFINRVCENVRRLLTEDK